MNPFWWFTWIRRRIGVYTASVVAVTSIAILLYVAFTVAYHAPLAWTAVILIVLIVIMMTGIGYVIVYLGKGHVVDDRTTDAGIAWLKEKRDGCPEGSPEYESWSAVLHDYMIKNAIHDYVIKNEK